MPRCGWAASVCPLRRPFYFPIDSGFTPAKKCQFDNGRRRRRRRSSLFPQITALSRLVLPEVQARGGRDGHAFRLHTVLKSFGGKARTQSKDGEGREEAPLSIDYCVNFCEI